MNRWTEFCFALSNSLGMGVVTASSSASGSPLGFYARFLTNHRSSIRRPCVLAFKTNSSKNKVFVATQDSITIPVDSAVKKSPQNGLKRSKKKPKKVKAVAVDDASPSSILELDYDTVAANLETIYKLSPDNLLDLEGLDPSSLRQVWWKRDTINVEEDEITDKELANVVRSRKKKSTRLSLDNRIVLKRKKTGRIVDKESNVEKVDRLVRDYSVSTDLVRMDWKKMKIPEVLPSSEHTWLFNLMQTMKVILEVKESLRVDLARDPTDGDLAAALKMTTSRLRRQLEVGRAARNKLIKHNLRLVLFVINKYFQDFANGSKFHDLCQAGVKGLITAIDRFEQKRGFRLSTYGVFWIRHAIIRSMTVSSFTRVPFGIESIRQEIQKAKLQLIVELDRIPEEDEIIKKVGLSSDRYHDIMKASKQVLSLHSRHAVTQEEIIKGITDVDGADKRRQPALLRLALDDVLDSLKPKESLVIRQRYGLDGKGDRTLGEIGGNLNLSREMVRKYEVKALMKLKHPARVDYLRRYIT